MIGLLEVLGIILLIALPLGFLITRARKLAPTWTPEGWQQSAYAQWRAQQTQEFSWRAWVRFGLYILLGIAGIVVLYYGYQFVRSIDINSMPTSPYFVGIAAALLAIVLLFLAGGRLKKKGRFGSAKTKTRWGIFGGIVLLVGLVWLIINGILPEVAPELPAFIRDNYLVEIFALSFIGIMLLWRAGWRFAAFLLLAIVSAAVYVISEGGIHYSRTDMAALPGSYEKECHLRIRCVFTVKNRKEPVSFTAMTHEHFCYHPLSKGQRIEVWNGTTYVPPLSTETQPGERGRTFPVAVASKFQVINTLAESAGPPRRFEVASFRHREDCPSVWGKDRLWWTLQALGLSPPW